MKPAMFPLSNVLMLVGACSTLILFFLVSRGNRWVLDRPTSRSSHRQPVSRLGGVALIGASIVAFALEPALVPYSLAVLILGIVGLIDDFRSLAPLLRLALQVVAGFTLLIPVLMAGSSAILIPITLLAVVIITNSANFMDGLNGMSGIHMLIWGITYGFLGHFLSSSVTEIFGALLAVLGLTFLPWNFPHARIFLGDGGSYTLGGIVTVCTVSLVAQGHPLVAAAPLLIYLTDVGTTLVQRALNGGQLTTPHRQHTYQLLASSCNSHVAAVAYVSAFSVGAAAVAIASATQFLSQPITVLLLALLAGLYWSLPKIFRPCQSRS